MSQQQGNRTVLVTGACGFIGAHLCRGLAERGDSVVAVDQKPLEADPELDWLLSPVKEKIAFVRLDTGDLAGLVRAARDHQVEAIIHAAALTDPVLIMREPLFSMKSMVGSTLNVLETARLLSLRRVIYISSLAVYAAMEYEPIDENHPVHRTDQPPSIGAYSSSKLASESIGLTYWGLYEVDFLALRLSAVYGFGMRYPMYIKPMVENALSGQATAFEQGGDMCRDYTYIGDVVDGTLRALDAEKALEQRIFNVSSGRPLVKASEVAQEIKRVLPEASIEIGGGRSEIEQREVKRGQLSIERAREAFGFESAYPIREGVKAYIEVYGQYLDETGRKRA